MVKEQTIALALCGVAPLGGCIELNSNVPPLVVNVKSEGDQCRVTVVRNPFLEPLDFQRVDQAQLLQIARQTNGRRAIVVSDVSAQYKCIGAAIVTLQEAGLHVDVASWDSR
jgi:hypothetical protein